METNNSRAPAAECRCEAEREATVSTLRPLGTSSRPPICAYAEENGQRAGGGEQKQPNGKRPAQRAPFNTGHVSS
jgi:hypothetical protein